MIALTGVLVVVGLVVAAIAAGRRGVELVSWLAGVGSFVVAVVTLFVTIPKDSSAGRLLRFSARARDNSQVFQAGGNITGSGNSRRIP
ncbi:hypothetical protein [Micromonospora sp. NPDC047740]|uniref:hypothetical protein n=1 Tax=Micromonospora sp. NPDC047740 TaxID=3364254 RepID=UPI00371B19E9